MALVQIITKNSQAFYLLHRIEISHRFAITFHRQTRQKTGLKSILDDIDGIGNKRKNICVHSVQSRK